MDNGASSYRRYLDGDDTGIVEIIKEYKDALMLYLNTYTGNIFTAEDLTEETFFKIAVGKPRFAEKSSFKTWLFAIARNVAIDYLRKNAKTVTCSDDECGEALACQADALEALLVEERKIILHRAMSRLKGEYFQVLHLIFFEDFTNSDAARIMKKSKRQIENLVYRAKKALKAELIWEGFEYEEL